MQVPEEKLFIYIKSQLIILYISQLDISMLWDKTQFEHKEIC